jgi:hypothetical protein
MNEIFVIIEIHQTLTIHIEVEVFDFPNGFRNFSRKIEGFKRISEENKSEKVVKRMREKKK